MVRAFVLYEGEVDQERYQQHIEEFVTPIPGTFRHGKVVATPIGEERFHYYAEFEFPDMESFQKVAQSPEFAAAGKDAAEMGIPFSAQVVVLG
jgi:antibiotic biosynthesis monooxygenase (ABM) superfamily enzyme